MSVTAKAFSSSANLGSGFDVLSMAHKAFYDQVTAELKGRGELKVSVISSDTPQDVEKNSAGYAVKKLLETLGIKAEISLLVKKGIPYGLGLGSSGASASAAVAAVNELLDLGLSPDEQVEFAKLGEIASSGSPHPDNVAASTFGGIVAVTSTSPTRVVRVPNSLHFKLLLIVPEKGGEGKTKKAREMLPSSVPLEKYVGNARYLVSLIVGLTKGDRDLVKRGLNDDVFEVARLPLFPHYNKVKEVALERDAVGVCVSGAGPSILVLYDERTDVEGIVSSSREVCKSFGINCNFLKTELAEGVRVERRD
ncbi:MAG: homoserine kinase [Candidatus Aramenus sp.]|jgi:homoserine kinase|nr:homoserine kinase [Candidatus Aramenus sp.]